MKPATKALNEVYQKQLFERRLYFSKQARMSRTIAQMQAQVSPATKAQRKRRIQEQLDPREEQMTRMALEYGNKKPESDRSDREALHLGILHSHIN